MLDTVIDTVIDTVLSTINNCMYSWQVHILTLPQELMMFPLGKVQTVRIELAHSGFIIIDFTHRFDNLFAVGHHNRSAATLFRLKYHYEGLTIKRC